MPGNREPCGLTCPRGDLNPEQPDLDGNLPVVGVQLADLIPHQFLPKLWNANPGSVP